MYHQYKKVSLLAQAIPRLARRCCFETTQISEPKNHERGLDGLLKITDRFFVLAGRNQDPPFEMVIFCLRQFKSEMHRVVKREINAQQGTHLMGNTVGLYIANEYVTAALCVQNCQVLTVLSLQIWMLKKIIYIYTYIYICIDILQT